MKNRKKGAHNFAGQNSPIFLTLKNKKWNRKNICRGLCPKLGRGIRLQLLLARKRFWERNDLKLYENKTIFPIFGPREIPALNLPERSYFPANNGNYLHQL
ncbi:hypothetical protein CEXT_744521 [Caerostris extrusa]|uniref:Uncharacterized protein n=1 Tax=Caerostris extrusa TaxID=172846 RepID=A0AAV4MKA4_CAEEX|nr:hypothetical protein CEXT_744521 [Caerostris extrusa]